MVIPGSALAANLRRPAIGTPISPRAKGSSRMHALDRRPGVSDHAFGSVGQSHGGNRMEYRNAPVEAPLLVVAEKVVALGRLTGAVLWEYKPGDQIDRRTGSRAPG